MSFKFLKKVAIAMMIVGLGVLQPAGGYTGSIVKVEAATKSSPKLSKTKVSVNVGKTYTLKLSNTKKTVTWSTSNKKVASIQKVGKDSVKVTGKKSGTAKITAKVGKKKYICKVTVKDAPKLNKSLITLVAGKTYDLKLSGTAATPKWSTSKKSIASISKRSKYVYRVKAIKAGTATIKVKVGGKTVSCKVKVTAKPKSTTPKLDAAKKRGLDISAYQEKDGIVYNTNWTVNEPMKLYLGHIDGHTCDLSIGLSRPYTADDAIFYSTIVNPSKVTYKVENPELISVVVDKSRNAEVKSQGWGGANYIVCLKGKEGTTYITWKYEGMTFKTKVIVSDNQELYPHNSFDWECPYCGFVYKA